MSHFVFSFFLNILYIYFLYILQPHVEYDDALRKASRVYNSLHLHLHHLSSITPPISTQPHDHLFIPFTMKTPCLACEPNTDGPVLWTMDGNFSSGRKRNGDDEIAPLIRGIMETIFNFCCYFFLPQMIMHGI